ncbi:MAG: hypothetical protein N2112_03905 [Gemmataceae bacterium]|nr:hypothetical protein [Gemmataceae bacterium]
MSVKTLQQNLSNWNPQGEGPHEATFPLADSWRIHLVVHKVESLASSIQRLTFVREPQIQGNLSRFATTLTQSLHGWLDKIQVIECDPNLNHAVLRSEITQTQNASIRYYEIRLFGTNQVQLECYVFDRATDSKREQVSFTWTHEMITKLAEEIVKANQFNNPNVK